MASISFRERHPALLRVWHWLNFVTILGLLLTVLLRKTVLSFRDNAVILQNKLSEMGVTITEDQAKNIAKIFRDNMWEWHINLGLLLSFLLLLRIIAEFVSRPDLRLWNRLCKSISFLKSPQMDRKETWHYILVKAGYVVFYLALVVMVATGLALTYEETLNLGKSLEGGIKETHELLMWFFVVFIGGHFLGVTVMELTKAPGLVSDMVHGGPKD